MTVAARAGALVALAAAAALAGCGSDASGGGTTTATGSASTPTASIPLAPPPPTDATTPTSGGASTQTATGPTQTSPESQPGGAGDEQPIRVPATFVARGGALKPSTVSVPAFLTVQITIVSGDSRAHVYEVETPRPKRIAVPAGGRGSVRVPGRRAGRYRIVPVAGGGHGGTLVTGGEPGP